MLPNSSQIVDNSKFFSNLLVKQKAAKGTKQQDPYPRAIPSSMNMFRCLDRSAVKEYWYAVHVSYVRTISTLRLTNYYATLLQLTLISINYYRLLALNKHAKLLNTI